MATDMEIIAVSQPTGPACADGRTERIILSFWYSSTTPYVVHYAEFIGTRIINRYWGSYFRDILDATLKFSSTASPHGIVPGGELHSFRHDPSQGDHEEGIHQGMVEERKK